MSFCCWLCNISRLVRGIPLGESFCDKPGDLSFSLWLLSLSFVSTFEWLWFLLSTLLLLLLLLLFTLMGDSRLLFRDDTREPFTSFFGFDLLLSSLRFSSTLLVLDNGRWTSSPFFLLNTFTSYGLKTSSLILSIFCTIAVGGGLVCVSIFLLFSTGVTIDLTLLESAPIWEQVWARRANGLFFESNCCRGKRKNKIN